MIADLLHLIVQTHGREKRHIIILLGKRDPGDSLGRSVFRLHRKANVFMVTVKTAPTLLLGFDIGRSFPFIFIISTNAILMAVVKGKLIHDTCENIEQTLLRISVVHVGWPPGLGGKQRRAPLNAARGQVMEPETS